MTDQPAPGPVGDPDGPAHPSIQQLRAYLDAAAGPEQTRDVEAHLEDCGRCLAALEELEPPVVLADGGGAPPEWDARRMRRAVRRTMLHIAGNTLGLLVLGAIGLTLLSALVWHPLAIDRGDRVAAAVTAAIDLPIMTIPGAEVEGFHSNPGTLRRITEVEVHRAVGPRMIRLGAFEARLGPFGSSGGQGRPVASFYAPDLRGGEHDPTRVAFEPDRLGPNTAVTVQLLWGDTTIGPAEADAVTDAAEDLSLLWVGFELPARPGREPGDPWELLGYSACQAPPDDLAGRGFGGGGFSRGGLRVFGPASQRGAAHALDELRRATANLATTDLLEDGRGGLADLPATAAWLANNDPGVTSVVITGPTESVAAAVEATSPEEADLLAVDFDRGAPEPCG